MSRINDTKRQQRWIMNAQLLCDLIADKKNLVNVIKVCDEATLWLNSLIDIFQEKVDPTCETNNAVLQDYLLEACASYGEANRSKTTWRYNEQSLTRQITFEISCLSPYAKNIAPELFCDATLNAEGHLANPDKKPRDITQSIIFKMIKLQYVSRHVCIMSQNLPEGTQKDTPELNKLFAMHVNGLRVFCSTFDKREGLPPKDADHEAVKRHYQEVVNNPNRPFTSEHRQRVIDRDDSHDDQQLLALHAGAAFITQKPGSTLGYIGAKIGLPERCDISGTTASIIGAAITWHSGNSEEECRKKAAYILSCMTVMCLMGHHSLAEVATAASLWSRYNYRPFRANSLWQILTSLCDANGADPDIDPNKILNFNDSHGWIEGKWRTLKLDEKIPDDIEFNDELWNLMRVMI